MIHRSSLWILEEEEELSGDLTDCSSGRRSDGYGRVAMSGSREWMWWRIMRLPMPFIEQRREERWYREGETVDDEWNYSMLPFWEEERNGQYPF
jgi:hypothetical protein